MASKKRHPHRYSTVAWTKFVGREEDYHLSEVIRKCDCGAERKDSPSWNEWSKKLEELTCECCGCVFDIHEVRHARDEDCIRYLGRMVRDLQDKLRNAKVTY